MNLIFFGAPGSGKSTQADILALKLGIPHLSTGDLFRNLEGDESNLGKRIKGQLQRGLLVLDNDVAAVVSEELRKSDYSTGVIIDGFQRTLSQVIHSPIKFDKALYLKVSDKTAIKRLVNRGREAETEEIIKKRLLVYHTETEPVLDYYRRQGTLIEIDGEGTEQEIATEIVAKLHLTANSRGI